MAEVCSGLRKNTPKNVSNMLRKSNAFSESLLSLIIKTLKQEMRLSGNGENGLSQKLSERKVDGRKSKPQVEALGCM